MSEGCVLGLLVLLLIGALGWLVVREDRQAAAACDRMWTLARNASDSIHVLESCELPSRAVPIVIPFVVPSR